LLGYWKKKRRGKQKRKSGERNRKEVEGKKEDGVGL